MPSDRYGQQISFSVEVNADVEYADWIWTDVKKNDTISKISSRHGHREDAREIADRNGIRSIYSKLSRKKVLIPGEDRQQDAVNVLAGDGPPTIVGGFPIYDDFPIPGRVTLNEFTGYDPILMDVPIRFEAVLTGIGVPIEDGMATLTRMYGRGNAPGAAVGEPPIIRCSTTDASGDIVPLIPRDFQWSRQNPHAPMWRIIDIDWDTSVPDGVLINDSGNRIRQKAVIHLKQATSGSLVERSAAARSKSKSTTKKKK
jgi:hypothetical protein